MHWLFLNSEDWRKLETAYGKTVEVELTGNVFITENKRLVQLNIRNIEDRLMTKDKIVVLTAEK